MIGQVTKEREKYEREIARLRTLVDDVRQKSSEIGVENGRLHCKPMALKSHTQEQATTIQMLLSNKGKKDKEE
jgi:hypothetical protein